MGVTIFFNSDASESKPCEREGEEFQASEKCSVHSRNPNWSRGSQRRGGRKQIMKGHLKTDVYSLTEGFRRT